MSEALAQIVNEDDEVIGHKPRREIDHATEIYRVAALWLANSKGEILLAQRGMSKELDPGRWGPAVAGTVEDDETYEGNIYKEAEEEIGLTGVEFEEGPKWRVHEPRNLFVQYFMAKIDRPARSLTMQPGEVMDIQWFPRIVLLRQLKEQPDRFTYSVSHMLIKTPENT